MEFPSGIALESDTSGLSADSHQAPHQTHEGKKKMGQMPTQTQRGKSTREVQKEKEFFPEAKEITVANRMGLKENRMVCAHQRKRISIFFFGYEHYFYKKK